MDCKVLTHHSIKKFEVKDGAMKKVDVKNTDFHHNNLRAIRNHWNGQSLPANRHFVLNKEHAMSNLYLCKYCFVLKHLLKSLYNWNIKYFLFLNTNLTLASSTSVNNTILFKNNTAWFLYKSIAFIVLNYSKTYNEKVMLGNLLVE